MSTKRPPHETGWAFVVKPEKMKTNSIKLLQVLLYKQMIKSNIIPTLLITPLLIAGSISTYKTHLKASQACWEWGDEGGTNMPPLMYNKNPGDKSCKESKETNEVLGVERIKASETKEGEVDLTGLKVIKRFRYESFYAY